MKADLSSTWSLRLGSAIAFWAVLLGAVGGHAEIRLESRFSSARATQGANFGASLSADGRWLVVGSPGDDEDALRSGSAYIFRRIQGEWVEIDRLREAVPTKGAEFGRAVAVAGSTIAISAPKARVDGVEKGAVYVYERVGSSWVEVAKLIAPEAKVKKFAGAVAVSRDRIAVASSGPRDENRVRNGAVYVFRREDEWKHESTLREDEPDPFTPAGFGIGLSLRGPFLVTRSLVTLADQLVAQNVVSAFQFGADGWVRLSRMLEPRFDRVERFGATTLIGGGQIFVGVGQPSSSDSVAVFDRQGRRVARLRPSDRSVFPGVNNFGRALAKKGRTLIVGGQDPFSRGSSGSAYVFERQDGDWIETAKLQPLEANFSFGDSVAVTSTSILVGATVEARRDGVSTGVVYSFRR